jgi:hypothetical protein
MNIACMAKSSEAKPQATRQQVRFDLTARAGEFVDYVVGKLFSRVERSGAANMIIEKMGALDQDMQDAILFKDGKDRELAMLQALRRKLATYPDDTSVDAELGRAEQSIAKAHKALARKPRPS